MSSAAKFKLTAELSFNPQISQSPLLRFGAYWHTYLRLGLNAMIS